MTEPGETCGENTQKSEFQLNDQGYLEFARVGGCVQLARNLSNMSEVPELRYPLVEHV